MRTKITVTEPVPTQLTPPIPDEKKNAVRARLVEVQGKIQEALQIIDSI